MIAPLHYSFDDFEAETDLGQKIFETIAAPPTTLITGITSDQKRPKADVSAKSNVRQPTKADITTVLTTFPAARRSYVGLWSNSTDRGSPPYYY
jgi:hypothetical protein